MHRRILRMQKVINSLSNSARRAPGGRLEVGCAHYEAEQGVTERIHTPGCKFCGSANTKFWFEHISKDDGKAYAIYRCRACKSGFVHPSPTPVELNEFYSSSIKYLTSESASENLAQVLEWEEKFPNATVDAERIAANLKSLSPGSRFLDVGSGCGVFSKAAADHEFSVTAIELNERYRGVFKLMNSFDALDAEFGEDFCARHAGSFDAVLLSQVLEHIPIESRPVENIHKVLSPNGVCAIAVPRFRSSVSLLQGKRDMFITPPEHLNFFTIRGLNALFHAHGFKMIRCETVSRFDRAKLVAKLDSNVLGQTLANLLNLVLCASDKFNGGMFIHAYFKKV